MRWRTAVGSDCRKRSSRRTISTYGAWMAGWGGVLTRFSHKNFSQELSPDRDGGDGDGNGNGNGETATETDTDTETFCKQDLAGEAELEDTERKISHKISYTFGLAGEAELEGTENATPVHRTGLTRSPPRAVHRAARERGGAAAQPSAGRGAEDTDSRVHLASRLASAPLAAPRPHLRAGRRPCALRALPRSDDAEAPETAAAMAAMAMARPRCAAAGPPPSRRQCALLRFDDAEAPEKTEAEWRRWRWRARDRDRDRT
jgi:hypothetical protein